MHRGAHIGRRAIRHQLAPPATGMQGWAGSPPATLLVIPRVVPSGSLSIKNLRPSRRALQSASAISHRGPERLNQVTTKMVIAITRYQLFHAEECRASERVATGAAPLRWCTVRSRHGLSRPRPVLDSAGDAGTLSGRRPGPRLRSKCFYRTRRMSCSSGCGLSGGGPPKRLRRQRRGLQRTTSNRCLPASPSVNEPHVPRHSTLRSRR